jgi:hypothetical protein
LPPPTHFAYPQFPFPVSLLFLNFCQLFYSFSDGILIFSDQGHKVLHVLLVLVNGTSPSASTFNAPSDSPCGTLLAPSVSPFGTLYPPSASPSWTYRSPPLTSITCTQNTLPPCSEPDPHTKICRKNLRCFYHESYLLSALLSQYNI